MKIDKIRERLAGDGYRDLQALFDIAYLLGLLDELKPHLDAAILACRRAEREGAPILRAERAKADAGPWRVGSNYGIHVYEGPSPEEPGDPPSRSVAMFHRPEDAARCVAAVNGRLSGIPPELRETLMEACSVAAAQALSGGDAQRYADARKQLEGL